MTAWWLTWLWQGVVLTLVASAAFHLLPRLNAATRYALQWVTLGALGALGAAGAAGATGAMGAAGAMGGMGAEAALEAYSTHLILVPSPSGALLTAVLSVWGAVALVALVRLLAGLRAVSSLRAQCRPFPADVEGQLPLWLEARARGRQSQLMLCDTVPGATVLGFGRPAILLSPPMLKALRPDDLDQIVLHEYAHVQRWDDWARLGQALLQSVLWIHPAVAIIGRRLNLEREMACDEWVVERTGLPRAYVRCLARAADLQARAAADPLMAPALFRSRRQLLLRVERLLASRGMARRSISMRAALGGVCVLMAAIWQLRAVPLVAEVGEIAHLVPPTMTPVAPVAPNAPVLALGDSSATRFPPAPRSGRGRFAPSAPHAPNAPNAPNAPDAPDAPNAPDAPSAPDAPDAPSAPNALYAPDAPDAPVMARSFDGRYAEPGAAVPTGKARRPWQMAGNAGVEIGAAARRASVDVADRVARAGVQFARRF